MAAVHNPLELGRTLIDGIRFTAAATALSLWMAGAAVAATSDQPPSANANAETIARSSAAGHPPGSFEGLAPAPAPLRYCVVCHGVALRGNPAVDAPNLSVLPPWYLERQMRGFRQGWRGTHQADLNGMEMRPQAAVLSEQEVADAVAFAGSVPARPAPATVDGDASRGEAHYQPCAVCHGARGEGQAGMQAPPLAGQSDWYLVTQLALFRSGARGSVPGDATGAMMSSSAMTLTDDQAVRDVVAYINTLTPAGSAP